MPKNDSSGSVRGSWSEAEDDMLRHYSMNGSNPNWAMIAQKMNGRTAKQCRERWVQNLRPGLDHTPIRPDEGFYITEQVNTIGKKWAEIARLLESHGLGCRSDNAVKNWFNGSLNRIERTMRRSEQHGHARSHGMVSAMERHQRHKQQRRHLRDEARHMQEHDVERRHRQPYPEQPTHLAPISSFSSRERALPPPASLVLSQQQPLPPPMPHATTPTTPVGYYDHEHAHYHQPGYASQHGASVPRYPGSYASQHVPTERHAQQQLRDCADRAAPYPSYSQQPPRYADRRASAYTVDSPRSEMADHQYPPSLVSDRGSPSARESPVYAPLSPTVLAPSNVLPPLAFSDDKDASDRSPAIMTRSWSSYSDDQYQHRPAPRRAQPAEPATKKVVSVSMLLN